MGHNSCEWWVKLPEGRLSQSPSSQERLDENRGKQGDNNDEIRFIWLRKERRSSGSREGDNMGTAFRGLEGNCKMKRNVCVCHANGQEFEVRNLLKGSLRLGCTW